MPTKRLIWPDLVKTVAIFLMVFCHFASHSGFDSILIYSFHMPVFFLVSGFFDKGESINASILKKNFMRIMIPYFFFSFCALSICWITPYLHPENFGYGTVLQTFGKSLLGIFLMDSYVHPYAIMPMYHLWFLVSLFEIKILFSVICLFRKKCPWLILPIVCLMVLAAFFDIHYFSLSSTVMAFPIYVAGYFLRKYNVLRFFEKHWENALFAIVGWLYMCFIAVRNGRVDINLVRYGDSVLLFYVNAIVGSLACIAACRALPVKAGLISVIGASTLTILGTHEYFGIVGRTAAITLTTNCGLAELPLWYMFLLSVVAMAGGVLIHDALNRKFPVLIGKWDCGA